MRSPPRPQNKKAVGFRSAHSFLRFFLFCLFSATQADRFYSKTSNNSRCLNWNISLKILSIVYGPVYSNLPGLSRPFSTSLLTVSPYKDIQNLPTAGELKQGQQHKNKIVHSMDQEHLPGISFLVLNSSKPYAAIGIWLTA